MLYRIRRNQNGSSELTHYGVKGMKWGVRKEYEKVGKKTNKSTNILSSKVDDVFQINEGRTGGAIERIEEYRKKDPRLGDAMATIVGYNTSKGRDRKFEQFEKDITNGYSNRDPQLNEWLKTYKETVGKNFSFEELKDKTIEMYVYGDSSKNDWSELNDLTEVGTALLDYFKGTYNQIPDEEDEEEQENIEQRAKLREELQKALKEAGVVINEKQHVYIDFDKSYSDTGECVFVYDDGSGNLVRAHPDELSILISRIKSDSEKLRDPRNKTTRERDIDPNKKAIKITKRERTDESHEIEKKKKITVVPAGTTPLSIQAAKKELEKKNRMERSINLIPGVTSKSMISRQNAISARGKRAAKSKTFKATMKKTLSNASKSMKSSISKAKDFVSNFIKDPLSALNIQETTTITSGGGGTGSTTVTTTKPYKKKT